MKERFPRLCLLFCCPPCMPAAALTMLGVVRYVRSRVFLAVGLHSSWTAPNWAPTSTRRARVLKQSTPWQPCCAGALLLQFARHTQHASAARRQRRWRWPNRARASRGAPSPTARYMIRACSPPSGPMDARVWNVTDARVCESVCVKCDACECDCEL